MPWKAALSSALLARSVRTTSNGTAASWIASMAGVESAIGQSSASFGAASCDFALPWWWIDSGNARISFRRRA